jgi:hypothetical protein
MSNKMKRTEPNDINIESKKIVDSIIKTLFENYKNTPHNEISEIEAIDTIEDIVSITDIIERIIIRRNNTYIIVHQKN